MTEENRSALYERMKRELLSRSPWLAQHASGRMLEDMIRAAMLTEVMAAGPNEEPDPQLRTS
jgi:hypothetical protein